MEATRSPVLGDWARAKLPLSATWTARMEATAFRTHRVYTGNRALSSPVFLTWTVRCFRFALGAN